MTKFTARSARRSLAAALAVGVAIALAACSTPTPEATDGGDEGGGALRIGFSPFTLQAPALKGLADALTGIAASQGDTVTVADPNADPQTQLEQITQWVELDQVDAIWVIPVAGPVVADAIKAALDKGIVVIASGVPDDYGIAAETPGITFTNVDNEDYGTKLGGLVQDCVAERLTDPAQVIYMSSPSGQQSSAQINDAVKGIVESIDGASIVNEQEAADRLGSSQAVASAIQGNPGANVVIGTDDESSLGALDAFKQAGLDPQTTCIVGAGGNDEAKAAVAAGELFGVVAFDFQADLGQNLAELHTLAADPTAPGHVLTTPILLVTE